MNTNNFILNIKNKYLLLPLLFIFLFFTACSVPITTKFSQNIVEIEKGDSAKLYWTFYDAEYVKVEGISNEFDIEIIVLSCQKKLGIILLLHCKNIKTR